MKKLLALSLAFALLCSLAACGGTSTPPAKSTALVSTGSAPASASAPDDTAAEVSLIDEQVVFDDTENGYKLTALSLEEGTLLLQFDATQLPEECLGIDCTVTVYVNGCHLFNHHFLYGQNGDMVYPTEAIQENSIDLNQEELLCGSFSAYGITAIQDVTLVVMASPQYADLDVQTAHQAFAICPLAMRTTPDATFTYALPGETICDKDGVTVTVGDVAACGISGVASEDERSVFLYVQNNSDQDVIIQNYYSDTSTATLNGNDVFAYCSDYVIPGGSSIVPCYLDGVDVSTDLKDSGNELIFNLQIASGDLFHNEMAPLETIEGITLSF